MTQVLPAIRAVNHLIVRERDLRVLARATCGALVETGAYSLAWLALHDEHGTLRLVAQAGLAPHARDELERSWQAAAPACAQFAPGDETEGIILVPGAACHDCPPGCRNDIVVTLRCNGSVYGLLSVSLPAGVPRREEELELIRQIAGDLALGIRDVHEGVARQRAEARYRALVEHANIGILIAAETTEVLEANREAAALFGLAPPELVGLSAFDLIEPEHRELLAAKLARLREQGSIEMASLNFRHRGGGVVSVDVSATAMTLGAERLHFVMLRDVTEQNKLKAQVMVADRMASVGTLAAGVAHEINNPLAVVLANLEYALKDAAEFQPLLGPLPRFAGFMDALREAREAGERVRLIVRDLKIFSRAEEDKRGPVNVEAVLDSSLRMAWNEIRHRARLVKDYRRVPRVHANEARLGQVFLNLAVNAAQALPEGHADANQIAVRTHVDERGRVVAEVRDTGHGIPPEAMKKLFTPFYTTKPVGVGTGLGLAICHRIVTGLGGEISAESEVGKGTVFRVVLPVARSEEAAEVDLAPPVAASPRRGRVLVIDDEVMIGSAVRRALRGDHEVTVTTSGRHALDLIHAGGSFHVILCDLMMPVMTGMELYEQLARQAPEQAARVVFLTGGAFTPAARAFLDDVPNLRIEKPFDVQNLRALVSERVR